MQLAWFHQEILVTVDYEDRGILLQSLLEIVLDVHDSGCVTSIKIKAIIIYLSKTDY
jgi:hypothetical protein